VATIDVRAQDRDQLATFLGWFSIGLGAAQVAAPRTLAKLVGAGDEGIAPKVMRAFGLRELTQGSGILVRPRPTTWVWSRVAGDALDLAALALVGVRNRKLRTLFAAANVLAVAAPDVYEARYLSRKRGTPRKGKRVLKAVTIAKPRLEVEQAWVSAAELREKVDRARASVAFNEAPGNRGTELVVDLHYAPPAGEIGAVAKKLTGNDVPTQLADDLRRFKQQVEAGEVVRSDSTPDGHRLADHLRQRAAQPVEEARTP
jgi:uncharacterized membrane protein